jgi:hypothetical protein
MQDQALNDRILKKVIDSGPVATWVVAFSIVQQTRKVRRILKKMEKDGLVRRHRFSSKNNLVWAKTGKIDRP